MILKSGFEDDSVKPLGPKRPMAYLAPSLRMMRVGESALIPKFPTKQVFAIARRLGIGIRITIGEKGNRMVRLAGAVSEPLVGAEKPKKKDAARKTELGGRRKAKVPLVGNGIKNWKQFQKVPRAPDIFS